jgi:WD40 repeat protein
MLFARWPLPLSATVNQTPRLFDLRNASERKPIPDVLPWHGGCAFSADSTKALVAVKDGQFSLLQTASGKELWRFHGARGAVTQLAMTPDATQVLSIVGTGSVQLWDAATNLVVRRFTPEKGASFQALALSADGRRLLLLSNRGLMELWDLQGGRKVRSLSGIGNNTTSVVMTRDGRCALTGHGNGRVRLWDLDRGEELCARSDDVSDTHCVALSPDGRLTLTGHHERVTLRDTLSGQIIQTISEKGGRILSVAFSHDGSQFAYGNESGNLFVRQTETRKLSWPAQSAHAPNLGALVFSRDGKRLYTGGNLLQAKPSQDVGTIRVWDTTTGKSVGTLPGHTAGVYCLALSPDGKRLLSGAGSTGKTDFSVRLWDLAEGKELKCFMGHTRYVLGVAFAPDGKRAV